MVPKRKEMWVKAKNVVSGDLLRTKNGWIPIRSVKVERNQAILFSQDGWVIPRRSEQNLVVQREEAVVFAQQQIKAWKTQFVVSQPESRSLNSEHETERGARRALTPVLLSQGFRVMPRKEWLALWSTSNKENVENGNSSEEEIAE
jgi:hypothetical protein